MRRRRGGGVIINPERVGAIGADDQADRPVPAGASTDFVARLMGDEVSRMHGATVVVENRPGPAA